MLHIIHLSIQSINIISWKNMCIPAVRELGALQPVYTSHMSLLQPQVPWHFSPYVGYGHFSVHWSPWYPGIHSEIQSSKVNTKINFPDNYCTHTEPDFQGFFKIIIIQVLLQVIISIVGFMFNMYICIWNNFNWCCTCRS